MIIAFFVIAKHTFWKNRYLNPAAIVIINKIEMEAFDYNRKKFLDREKLKITQAVEKISKREERMDFPQVYNEIEKR